MSKIVSMSSGAIDPIAQSKRVFYRPSTAGAAIVLSVGDAVCYRMEAEDHKKRTVDPTHLGLTIDTYQEGEQEMTSRLFCVEEPLIDNIDQFAGIVKCLGPKDGADGDMIEIWTGNSGAVVPCNLAGSITTVAGRTLLAVVVGQRTLGCPVKDIPNYGVTAGSTDSKIVGIAMEVRTTTGKCWVKLDENMFMHQGGNIGNELQVAAVADDVAVNKMNISFLSGADHNCEALHYRAKIAAVGGGATRGVFRFETIFAEGTDISNHIWGLSTLLELDAVASSAAPLHVTLRSRVVDPDLTGCSQICAVMIDFVLTGAAGGALANAPDQCSIFWINADEAGTTPDYFIITGAKGIGTLTGHDLGGAEACTHMIPIKSGATDLWIPAYTQAEIDS